MNRNKHATDDGFQRSQRRAPCRTHVPAGIIALSLFLVVAISGAASAGEAERAEAEAVVNLEFHDTDLAAALEALCRGADVNFVLEPGVKGKVTAKLLNTSWQTALDTILSGHGLRAERRGDTLLIARATPGAGGTAPKQRIDVEMTPDGKVSLDAAAADAHEVLHELASAAEMNIIAEKAVAGNVTISLRGLSPKEVLMLLADCIGAEVIDKGGVMRVTARAAAPSAGSVEYTRPVAEVKRLEDGTLMVHARNAELHQLLAELGSVSDANIVAAQGISGSISIDLNRVTVEDATMAIGASAGLTFREVGNILVAEVATQSLKAQTFRLRYAKAEEVAAIITTSIEEARAAVDVSTNSLVVTGTPDELVAAAQIVEGLEASPVQVTIETRIVETNLTGEESFGIKWSESIGINATTPEIPHSWPLRNGKTSDSDDFLPTIDPDDTRTRGDNVVPHAESDDFKFGFLTSTGLSATLDMLETETKTRLLANPTVTTYENQQARINIVTKYPMAQYQVSQDTGVLSISGFDYKEFGTILEVTPRVRGDHVIMQIHPEVSRQAGSTQFQGVELPVIQSQETQTQVRIKGGDTLVIAGLIREETENNKQDVPFISKIPLLGRLFRHKQDKIDSRRNLMIFITPHIVGSADFARDAKLRTLRTEPLPTVEAFDKE